MGEIKSRPNAIRLGKEGGEGGAHSFADSRYAIIKRSERNETRLAARDLQVRISDSPCTVLLPSRASYLSPSYRL